MEAGAGAYKLPGGQGMGSSVAGSRFPASGKPQDGRDWHSGYWGSGKGLSGLYADICAQSDRIPGAYSI